MTTSRRALGSTGMDLTTTRALGTTGMNLSTAGLGAWVMGGEDWQFAWGPQDDADSIATIHRAVGAGVNWIDTAAAYGLGHSEDVVGRAVAALPAAERPYLFTKTGLVWDDPSRRDSPPRRLMTASAVRRELEESLRRLRTDHIDLYQVHWPGDGTLLTWDDTEPDVDGGAVPAGSEGGQDAPISTLGAGRGSAAGPESGQDTRMTTPETSRGSAAGPESGQNTRMTTPGTSRAGATELEEYWQTMADLRAEGKVRAIGLSNHSVAELDRAEKVAHVDAIQPPFSALVRHTAGEIAWSAAHGTGVIVYQPMHSGLLTGAFDAARVAALPANDWRHAHPDFTVNLPRNLLVVDALRAVAGRHGVPVAAVAVAWTLAWPGVTGAIVGARRPSQITGWLPGAALSLTTADLDEIAAAITAAGVGEGPARPAAAD